MNRTEKDFLGTVSLPEKALYGIHSLRAAENFPSAPGFPQEWFRAMGLVKGCVYRTYKRFRDAATARYGDHKAVRIIEDSRLDAMSKASEEVAAGGYIDSFIVPAIQGGAGTSINMNINEIIANAALITMGNNPGDYSIIDPVEDCNIYQSTNDVVPTALTIATMNLLNDLSAEINSMRQIMESLEKEHRNKLRPGYTQMQEAVPSSFGLLFGAYNEALSRDWWRVSKSLERIRTVNMGGGATGTGMAIPRFFIMEIVPELRDRTGLPLSRSENLSDTTSNLDKWVEVHAIIKSHAVNLEKLVSDLRLLSSDLLSPRLLTLPDRQVGSSIMPGKINPVIPEYVISVSHRVYANDQLISSLSGQGCLELNAYLPVIGVTIIESLKLLVSANRTLRLNTLTGLGVNHAEALKRVIMSPAITTALIPFIGYNKASEIARVMKEKMLSIFEANGEMNFIEDDKLEEILQPANLLKLGFSLEEIKLKRRDDSQR
jgi:aspartate ammonia-lyase